MELDDIFHPRSIAVVGASAGPENIHTQMFLDTLIQFGYEGELYPINPKSEPVFGLKTYPNLEEVPGPVDHVISLIPAAVAAQLIRDSISKGVKTVHFFTAGFDETGEPDGKRLQGELASLACSGGVRILGPNCVGIYCPESRISYAADFPKEAGRVSFVAQSGGYTYLAVRMAAARGVRFSKVAGYGNASDINEIDLLDYLSSDPDTEIICAYIEGTRDGQRLLKVLAEAAAKKPVVVIKRGHTEAGSRGVRSHTGSLAGDDKVWEAAFRQAGVIRVQDVEEMVDMMVTFLFLSLPQGRNVVVLGVGGGASVRASDECEAGGLRLPPVPDDLRAKVNRYIPLAGSMLRNPMDVLAEPHGNPVWVPILKALDGWEEADMLLWQMSPEMEPLRGEIFSRFIIDVRAGMLEAFKHLRKPKAIVVHAVETLSGLEELDAIRAKCAENRIAFYPSVYRAAQAISRCMDYYDWRERQARS
ncbi:MAG: CoA-binding protein [Chloroflexi bacterium]|nr:CoA-binding protein [Chloroflexota bacterium]